MAAGIYIHIPFCKSRCSYCDFATEVYREPATVERYVTSLRREIEANGKIRTSVDTVYFGGGTPSLLMPSQAEQILEAVKGRFDILPGAELTMEMNPATVTAQTLASYKELGINRASFGVQTFDERALKVLARGHSSADARDTFRLLREAGFDNISLDLIAGLPGQRMRDWEYNLDEAINLGPEHISLYLLEIHANTPLAEQVRSGRQPAPDDDLAAEMYETMLGRLDRAGYIQYEISNFCKPGFESRHNLKYWRLDPVYGFGVSAHSYDGIERYANARDTDKYIEMIEAGGSAEVTRETIELASEAAFLGLRLESGIDLAGHKAAYGEDLLEKYNDDLRELATSSLIDVENGHLKLTRRGKLFSNEVFEIFV